MVINRVQNGSGGTEYTMRRVFTSATWALPGGSAVRGLDVVSVGHTAEARLSRELLMWQARCPFLCFLISRKKAGFLAGTCRRDGRRGYAIDQLVPGLSTACSRYIKPLVR